MFAFFSVLLRKFAVTNATGPRSGPLNGVRVNCCWAKSGVALESATCTVKVKLLPVVGVPVIAPVEAARLNPVGNAPATMLQV